MAKITVNSGRKRHAQSGRKEARCKKSGIDSDDGNKALGWLVPVGQGTACCSQIPTSNTRSGNSAATLSQSRTVQHRGTDDTNIFTHAISLRNGPPKNTAVTTARGLFIPLGDAVIFYGIDFSIRIRLFLYGSGRDRDTHFPNREPFLRRTISFISYSGHRPR